MLVRHVGAQVVQRVADLADDVTDVRAQLFERGTDEIAAGVALHDPVELEGQIGERLADAVMEVASDAGALFFRSDRAQSGEPPGVVDGECRRLGEALQQLDIAVREVPEVSMLQRHQSDHRAAGQQHHVDAGVHPRCQSGSSRDQQVRLGNGVAVRDCAGQRRRELVRTEAMGEPGALATGHHPSSVGVVEEQHGSRGAVEQIAQAAHRGVERLVEIERRRQRLGDAVQREQQRVGVGEATEAVEGQRLLTVGLARDPAGIAGDERDEHHLRRPLRGHSELRLVGAEVLGHGHGRDRDAGDEQREREPA